MATRTKVYSKEEILAEDFNNLRNSYEKALFTSLVGQGIPSLPAFITNSFKCSQIPGNKISVNLGIGFQRIAQVDESTDIRLMNLESVTEIDINLPGTGTQYDLIEARSVIVSEQNENRLYKRGGAVVSEATEVADKWSAEIQVKSNVTADANGVFTPSLGWVALAVIQTNSTGILSVTDLRTVYELFSTPDERVFVTEESIHIMKMNTFIRNNITYKGFIKTPYTIEHSGIGIGEVELILTSMLLSPDIPDLLEMSTVPVQATPSLDIRTNGRPRLYDELYSLTFDPGGTNEKEYFAKQIQESNTIGHSTILRFYTDKALTLLADPSSILLDSSGRLTIMNTPGAFAFPVKFKRKVQQNVSTSTPTSGADGVVDSVQLSLSGDDLNIRLQRTKGADLTGTVTLAGISGQTPVDSSGLTPQRVSRLGGAIEGRKVWLEEDYTSGFTGGDIQNGVRGSAERTLDFEIQSGVGNSLTSGVNEHDVKDSFVYNIEDGYLYYFIFSDKKIKRMLFSTKAVDPNWEIDLSSDSDLNNTSRFHSLSIRQTTQELYLTFDSITLMMRIYSISDRVRNSSAEFSGIQALFVAAFNANYQNPRRTFIFNDYLYVFSNTNEVGRISLINNSVDQDFGQQTFNDIPYTNSIGLDTVGTYGQGGFVVSPGGILWSNDSIHNFRQPTLSIKLTDDGFTNTQARIPYAVGTNTGLNDSAFPVAMFYAEGHIYFVNDGWARSIKIEDGSAFSKGEYVGTAENTWKRVEEVPSGTINSLSTDLSNIQDLINQGASLAGYVGKEVLGEIPMLTLPASGVWVASGITVPDGVTWLAINFDLGDVEFSFIDWSLVLLKDAATAGDAPTDDDTANISDHGLYESFPLKIGRTVDNEILFANGTTNAINHENLKVETITAAKGEKGDPGTGGGGGGGLVLRHRAARHDQADDGDLSTYAGGLGTDPRYVFSICTENAINGAVKRDGTLVPIADMPDYAKSLVISINGTSYEGFFQVQKFTRSNGEIYWNWVLRIEGDTLINGTAGIHNHSNITINGFQIEGVRFFYNASNDFIDFSQWSLVSVSNQHTTSSLRRLYESLETEGDHAIIDINDYDLPPVGTDRSSATLPYEVFLGQTVVGSDADDSGTAVQLPDVVGETEAQIGTSTTARLWTAQRVRQAIEALQNDIRIVHSLPQTGDAIDEKIRFDNLTASSFIWSFGEDLLFAGEITNQQVFLQEGLSTVSINANHLRFQMEASKWDYPKKIKLGEKTYNVPTSLTITNVASGVGHRYINIPKPTGVTSWITELALTNLK